MSDSCSKQEGSGVSNYNLYDRNTANKACEWFKERSEETGETNPWIQAQERYMSKEVNFVDEEERILAIRAYYGLCSFLDEQVGIALDALGDYGLSDNTRIIYTSDHGENIGSRRICTFQQC